jgi:hypothetical protein
MTVRYSCVRTHRLIFEMHIAKSEKPGKEEKQKKIKL